METIDAVVGVLERNPVLVTSMMREMREDVTKRRPASEGWSAHEHACHLANVDRMMIDRLDQVLAEPEPTIVPYDPARDESSDTFLSMDLDAALKRYQRDRTVLMGRLRGLSPGDWQRTAKHGDYNHYSVYVMFRHLAMHDLFHAYRIEELLLQKDWPSSY